jgi:prepilin-type N-terminal cleavage/methylation domain-containing protein
MRIGTTPDGGEATRDHKALGNASWRSPGNEGTKSGFVLWEMLLALSIFSIVALSLSTALQQTANTARLLRQDSQVRHDLESILVETSTIKLAAGKNEIALGDQRVRYVREVAPVLAKNSRGQPLDHLWRITVRATWQETNQSRSSQAELIVYQP